VRNDGQADAGLPDGLGIDEFLIRQRDHMELKLITWQCVHQLNKLPLRTPQAEVVDDVHNGSRLAGWLVGRLTH
jgi:hypothetical protein